MNLEEFDLSKLLNFSHREGKLTLLDDRMLIFRHEAFAFLRSLLFEQLGGRTTQAILSQFGYRCGFGDFEVLSTAFEWDSEQDALGCGPVMHGWEGIVAVEPTKMDFDHDTGAFDFRGLWRNSYEADIQLSQFGISDHPVCFSLTGYASGWCTAFFGRPLLAIEHRCVGKGDDVCEWHVQPADKWGPEADMWREALDATDLSITRKLEGLVAERTETIEKVMEELEHKNRKLTELDGMKSEFMANVSHELRTPLTLILGPLESLLASKEGELPRDVRQGLERMGRNGNRLYALVNELLDFTKLEAGRVEMNKAPVDVCAVASEVVADAMPQAEVRGLTLALDTPPQLPLLALDRRMTEKILINLVGNALKFTPDGGEVHVGVALEGEEVQLRVKDSGPGIPLDKQEVIFERFQQVDSSSTRRFEGTGLGLALVKEFSMLQGGHVVLDSTPGNGACFTVHLPAERTDADSGSLDEDAAVIDRRRSYSALEDDELPRETPGFALPSDRPHILVADDSVEMRRYLGDLLRRKYELTLVENGRQALEAARLRPPTVILSDVMMPEMDGLQLTAAIKEDPDLRHIPIILLTARAGVDASASGLDSGADDYIAKPFSEAELHARLRAALRIREMYEELQNQNLQLQEEIEARVRAEEQRRVVQRQLVEASRVAGRAEVATNFVHRVGTIVNSLLTSLATLGSSMERTSGVPLARMIEQLDEGVDWIRPTGDEQPAELRYLRAFASNLTVEQERMATEITALRERLRHIEDFLVAQGGIAQPANCLEEIDLPELLDCALMLSAADRSPEVDVILDVLAEQSSVVSDRHKLMQILTNLLRNAQEALAFTAGERRLLRIAVETNDKQVDICVEDNGRGIPAEELDDIFRDGYSTKPGGVGLGLHVSANVARELGGALRVTSEGPGQGATFTLELPR